MNCLHYMMLNHPLSALTHKRTRGQSTENVIILKWAENRKHCYSPPIHLGIYTRIRIHIAIEQTKRRHVLKRIKKKTRNKTRSINRKWSSEIWRNPRIAMHWKADSLCVFYLVRHFSLCVWLILFAIKMNILYMRGWFQPIVLNIHSLCAQLLFDIYIYIFRSLFAFAINRHTASEQLSTWRDTTYG